MPTIPQLIEASSLSAGDLLIFYSSSNGSARKIAVSAFVEAVKNLLPSQNQITQYANPTASAFSVKISNTPFNLWLILAPTGAFAAGSIVLPSIEYLTDKQEILVNCSQPVTALTIDGNGASISGAPSSIAAFSSFKLKYDIISNTWYKV